MLTDRGRRDSNYGRLADWQWERLTSFSDTFTCYSAAIATWTAASDARWPAVVNPGLCLTLTSRPDGIFGFAYFRPTLRAELDLERTGSDEPDQAIDGVLRELSRTGRVIVAGDGFRLPWHVAYERRHAPHWYVLQEAREGFEVFDAFTARNDLGMQTVTRRPVSRAELPQLLMALPEDDTIFRLREVFAFGDEAAPLRWHRYQWFVHGGVDKGREPSGPAGPDAVRRLAAHFRDRGQELAAYGQADDIWSIARHRSFLCRVTEEAVLGSPETGLADWLDVHARPLATRWSHVAPLLLQATLSLESGRQASMSVADTLDELAEREAAARASFPGDRVAVPT
jgi:hypothetical protein